MTADDVVRRQQGLLTDWNDDRGFGFITPTAGGSRVFAHVSAFPRGRRPVAGCEVTYAEYVGAVPAGRSGALGALSALAAAALFFALLLGLFTLDQLPVTLLGAYALFSAAAFLACGADKTARSRTARHMHASCSWNL